MNDSPKPIPVALRDFAVPVPRIGSIEVLSGYGTAAAQGRDIHSRVQKKRAAVDPSYESEVPVSCEFDREGYRFRIDGRMDGIFRQDTPHIEEIKTSFDVQELFRRLSDSPLDHPYCLQLLTYGYFHWLEHGTVPKLSFHLVSTRSSRSVDLEQELDIPAYERWLELRLAELVVETRKAEKRAARRRKIAANFAFPFAEPRPGQIELIATIEQGLQDGTPMLIQAPTGLGKTAGVLYPVLREALGRGQTTVYVTPKNSQHSVAEDAVERFQAAGSKVRPLTITAKGKICFKEEPLCDPGYCEYARDYYAKVREHGILDSLGRKRKLTARVFRKIGEEHEVCPFELQLDAASDADLVICDYNYVFAPRSAFGRLAMTGVDQDGKPNLVIDEAHNLPARAMNYYSPSLSSFTLEAMRTDMHSLPPRFRRDAEALLDDCLQALSSCRPEKASGPARIDPPADVFFEQDSRLGAFLARYLDNDIEIGRRDAVLGLCRYWSEFTEGLAYAADPSCSEFFTTFHPGEGGGTVRITCCDASAMLRDRYDAYGGVVGFSATLKPFAFYAALSGLDPATVRTAEFRSPFPRENRKVMIIPQVSTRYRERELNYPKIADAISRIVALRRGNYFSFFPSFEFLERVLALLQAPEGYAVLRQEREMRAQQIEEVIRHLRGQDNPTILFAVQGGIFSEGMDYPGEMAIGAFVIGPPLPPFDLEREGMREFYEKRYGAGFDYAYAFPAMARAVQAAGRVIRSETDRGLIVLMDSRFVQPGYSRSMPSDWFESSVNELVSGAILQDIAEFWNGSGCSRPADRSL